MVAYVPYTTTTVGAFTTTTVVALTTATVNALASWQVAAFTTTQCSALTTTQLAALNVDGNGALQGNSTQIAALTTTQQTALGQQFYPPSVGVFANTPVRLQASVTTALTGLGTSLANMSYMGQVPLTGGQIIGGNIQIPFTSTQSYAVIVEQDLSGKLSILTSVETLAQTAGTTTQVYQLALPNPDNNTAYSVTNYGNATPGANLYLGVGATQAGGVQGVLDLATFK